MQGHVGLCRASESSLLHHCPPWGVGKNTRLGVGGHRLFHRLDSDLGHTTSPLWASNSTINKIGGGTSWCQRSNIFLSLRMEEPCSLVPQPSLPWALIDSWSEFLSLPWKCKKCFNGPFSASPSPAPTRAAWLKRAFTLHTGWQARVLLWLAVSWGSPCLQKQR